MRLASLGAVALAQGWTLGIPPLISSTYFPKSEVGLATGLSVLAMQIGPGIPYFSAHFFFAENAEEDGEGLQFYMLVQMVLTGVVVLLVICTTPYTCPPVGVGGGDKPKGGLRAFSMAVVTALNPKKTSPSFLLLALAYGVITGSLISYSTLMSELLPNLSETDLSMVSERSELVFWKMSILAMKCAKSHPLIS
tara:strand:+ start:47 stop:628 length:582 start_codon:yes stop_codon:yes gene_type:complete